MDGESLWSQLLPVFNGLMEQSCFMDCNSHWNQLGQDMVPFQQLPVFNQVSHQCN